ncbi:MAG: hypothetical protein WDN49_18575 [Acetobacteraceae bacterium]
MPSFICRRASRSPPAIVALHGCGGPFPRRDAECGASTGGDGPCGGDAGQFRLPRLGSQCANPSRAVTASLLRRQDALATMKWLAARPGTPPGGVVLMGWSDGGTTVLAAGRTAPDLPPGAGPRADRVLTPAAAPSPPVPAMRPPRRC